MNSTHHQAPNEGELGTWLVSGTSEPLHQAAHLPLSVALGEGKEKTGTPGLGAQQ